MSTSSSATVKVPVIEATEREREEASLFEQVGAAAAASTTNDDEAAESDGYYALPCTD